MQTSIFSGKWRNLCLRNYLCRRHLGQIQATASLILPHEIQPPRMLQPIPGYGYPKRPQRGFILRSNVRQCMSTLVSVAHEGYPTEETNKLPPQGNKYRISRLSGQAIRSKRQPPTTSLAIWIQENITHRQNRRRKTTNPEVVNPEKFLPTILLHYLRSTNWTSGHAAESQPPTMIPKNVFSDAMVMKLWKSGFMPQDVLLWAWIITADTGEEAARRFLGSPSKPAFLLLRILDQDNIRASTFKRLIVHSWTCLTADASRHDLSAADIRPEFEGITTAERGKLVMEETTFMVMVCRLLKYARKVLPAAQISISHMIPTYFAQLADSDSNDEIDLTPKQHWKLCKIYNKVMRILSLPAAITPLKSMKHNWRAQQVLLERAENFNPPLELDHNSYRAVARVLAASKKSNLELKFARLMKRSWPPWRDDQDGVDAMRPRTDDISRVANVVSCMKEAGYSDSAVDRAMKIIGGRDSDGSPTVQTRSVTKSTGGKQRMHIGIEWAARIRATRDVQEAWNAFLAFDSHQHKPTIAMFYAMFEKLIFEKARRYREREHNPTAGDGKEVMTILNENVSDSEKLRVRPPTVEELYFRMLKEGLRPQGQCLAFLVIHACSIKWGVRYLRDSDIQQSLVQSLLGKESQMSHVQLSRIPDSIFTAYVNLLCRFQGYQSLSNRRRYGDFSATYGEPQKMSADRGANSSPLQYAIALMRIRRPTHRPAWNTLFRTIARSIEPGRHFVGETALSAIQSWELLAACVSDSHNAGVELDPEGFLIICNGLDATIQQTPGMSEEHPATLNRAIGMVKRAFNALTEKSESGFHLPSFVHIIRESHLHAYIRVLGAAGDMQEIMTVMRWMAGNKENLDIVAMESKNGRKLLRRTLVAMRVYVDENTGRDDLVSHHVKNLVNRIPEWGGWPTDEEVDAYKAYGNISAEMQ